MAEGEIDSNRTMAPIATTTLSNHHLVNNANGKGSLNTNTSISSNSITAGSENNIHHKGKVERPASKSRRMSSGGSRMAANADDENGDRSGYGRSASDSGSEWYHATAADKVASSSSSEFNSRGTVEGKINDALTESRSGITSNDANDQSKFHKSGKAGANGTGLSRSSSNSAPYLDLVTYPPQDLLRILAALLNQIATANDQLRPRGGTSGTTSGAEMGTGGNSEKRRKNRERNAAPEHALANSSGSAGMAGDDSFTGDRRVGSETSGIGDESGEGSGWQGETSERGLSSSQQLLLSRSKPTTAALGALQTPSSTLCFRARNIPSISIEAYLLRILRYCPASCEVFVSLLVYFDRMSKMGQGHQDRTIAKTEEKLEEVHNSMTSASSSEMGKEKESEKMVEPNSEGNQPGMSRQGSGEAINGTDGDDDGLFVGMRGFAIDSFNVHRLVIAGVTVASKFFSDVFYTNSRYAKVGGLPVHELNQLELQFLLLNNFNLMIPLEEMQRYANQLLVYGGASTVSPYTSKAVLAADNLPSERTDGDTRIQERHADVDTEAANAQQSFNPVSTTRPPASPRPEPSDQHGDTAMGEA